MRQKNYDVFNDSLLLKTEFCRSPLVCDFDLTYRCNLSCRHCYLRGISPRGELEFREIKRIIDELRAEGCLYLTFSGGEPFLREDFLKIYLYAKKKGFLLTIFSNLTLLNDAILNVFREHAPLMIETTLNSMEEKKFDRITRTRGYLPRFIGAVKKITENKLPLAIKTTGMKINKDEIDDIQKYAESIGAGFKFDTFLLAGHKSGRVPLNSRLTPEEALEAEIKNPDSRAQWLRCASQKMEEREDYRFDCIGGINSCYVSPRGEMRLCVHLLEPAYKLGLVKAGFDYLKKIRDSGRAFGLCRSCRVRKYCWNCPAIAALEKRKDYLKYFCRLAELRSKHFDRRLPV